MNVTPESLKKLHGDNANAVYAEIAQLSGAGEINSSGIGNHIGGIDLTGVFDPENKAFTTATREKIQSLIDGPKAEKDGKKEGKN